jgi:hypothetical protein
VKPWPLAGEAETNAAANAHDAITRVIILYLNFLKLFYSAKVSARPEEVGADRRNGLPYS